MIGLLLLLCLSGFGTGQALAAVGAQANDLLLKANAALKRQQWPSVIKLATQAIEMEQKAGRVYSRAYSYRGFAYEKLNKMQEALADYRKVGRDNSVDYAGAQKRIKAILKTLAQSGPKPTPRPTQTPPESDPTYSELPLPPLAAPPPLHSELWPQFKPSAWLDAWRGKAPTSQAAHNQPITALAATPDGTLVASGSWQKTDIGDIGEIALWRFNGTSMVLTNRATSRFASEWSGVGARPAYYGHFGHISSLQFSPTSGLLASGGKGGGVTLWNKAGQPLRVLRDERVIGSKAASIIALAWKGDAENETLFALDADAQLWSWSRTDYGEFQSKGARPLLGTNGGRGWVQQAVFSTNTQMLAVGDGNGNVSVHLVETGSRLGLFRNSQYQEMGRDGIAATALAFNPQGDALSSANFAHLYLNGVQSKTPIVPLAFANRIAHLKAGISQLCWISPTLLLTREATGFAIVQPDLLQAPKATGDSAVVGEISSFAAPTATSLPRALYIPAYAAVIDAVPSSTGSALTVLNCP